MNIVELFPKYSKTVVNKDPGQIILELRKYGHDVRVVTDKIDANRGLNEFNGVKVIKLPKIEIFSISFGLLYYLLGNSRKIDCLLLYHITINTGLFSLVFRLLSRKGIIVIKLDNDGRVWEHSIPLFFKILRLFLKETRIIPYIISKTSNIIIAESPESRIRIIKRYPFFENKLTVLPNGIDYQTIDKYKGMFPNEKKTNKILFVGSICYRKGIDLLIQAFALLKNSYPGWIIEITGGVLEPEYDRKLRNLITSLNMESRVTFSGHLDAEFLVKKYLESEIFCLPSRHESFGLVILEAMYLGVPVISANAGCAEYLLDYGNSGMIFDRENIDELRFKLKALIENDKLRKEFSEKARKRFLEVFTWDKIINELNNMIMLLKPD